MKIYFFGSPTCKSCHELLNSFNKCDIPLLEDDEFCLIDALSDDQEEFCDSHEVDDLPHVKLYANDDSLLFEQSGLFDPMIVKRIMEERRQYEKNK